MTTCHYIDIPRSAIRLGGQIIPATILSVLDSYGNNMAVAPDGKKFWTSPKASWGDVRLVCPKEFSFPIDPFSMQVQFDGAFYNFADCTVRHDGELIIGGLVTHMNEVPGGY